MIAPQTCVNLYSGDPTNSAGWTPTNLTLTAAGGTGSPTGYATEIVATSTGPINLQSVSVPNTDYPSTRYTLAVWVKQQTLTDNSSNIWLWLSTFNGNTSGNVNGVVLTLPLDNPPTATAQITTDDPTSLPWSSPQVSVLALPNGWYEVSVSGITGSDLTNAELLVGIATGTASITTGQSFLLGGACVYYDMGPVPPPPFVLTTNSPASVATYPAFTFPYFDFAESYPVNTHPTRLGRGFMFTTPAIAPPQRRFTLSFEGMGWVLDSLGNVDVTSNSDFNVAALIEFYKAVQLYGAFTFQHPMDGQLLVRFAKPLDVPAVMKGAPFNTVHPFQVDLVEVISAQVAPTPLPALNLTMGGGNTPTYWCGASWQVTPSTAVPPPFPGAQVFETACVATEGDSNCFETGIDLAAQAGVAVSRSLMVWVPSSQAASVGPIEMRSDSFTTTISAPVADLSLTDQWQLVTYTGITGAGDGSTPDSYLSVLAAGTSSTPIGAYFYVSAPMANLSETPQGFVGGPYPLFDFPYATFAERYPTGGAVVQSGTSYQFATPPQGPPARVFTLSFDGMGWLLNPTTGVLDATVNPQFNVAALRAFYQQVQLSGLFYLDHPIDGLITVRFAKPLDIPAVRKGAPFNTVKSFQLEMIEVF